jgi:hypothetical protein
MIKIIFYFLYFISFSSFASFEYDFCISENAKVNKNAPDYEITTTCKDGEPVINQYNFKFFKNESNPDLINSLSVYLNKGDFICNDPGLKKALYAFNIEIIYTDKNNKVLTKRTFSPKDCPSGVVENSIIEQSEYFGIGAMLEKTKDGAKIISIVPGSPSSKIAIREKDVIIEINNQIIKDFDLAEIVSKLRGLEGTKVDILIKRPGAPKPLHFSIVRERINSK